MAAQGETRSFESPASGPGRTACANSIFQQPWWLDAVAPGRWDEVAVIRGGRVVARLPYVVGGRGGARVLRPPPSTPTLGPWIEPTSRKTAKGLGLEMELLAELEPGLPPARAFAQRFAPAGLNALPFHWAGYRLEVRYTYRIDGLGAGEDPWERLRDGARRVVEAGRRRLEVRDDLGLDRFTAVLAAGSGPAPGVPPARLHRIDAACAPRGARWILFAC